MVKLYKIIDNQLKLINYGTESFMEIYKKQGYIVSRVKITEKEWFKNIEKKENNISDSMNKLLTLEYERGRNDVIIEDIARIEYIKNNHNIK